MDMDMDMDMDIDIDMLNRELSLLSLGLTGESFPVKVPRIWG